jgi:mRNA interferase MazF
MQMNAHTKTYNAYDIVKVQFPFADKDKYKKRPALVISPSKLLGAPIGISLVTMITSVDPEKEPWGSDILIEDLGPTNLKHSSFIRFKIFSLDHTRIEDRIGYLGEKDIKSVKEKLAELFSFQILEMVTEAHI